MSRLARNLSRYFSHIFYIYSEASVAVMLSICALIELGCYLVVDLFWQPFALASAAFLAVLALLQVITIVRHEREWNARRREWSDR
jgi:hypothetical protein